MTHQQLLAERDRIAAQYNDIQADSFKVGFDVAIALMLEREKVLREALLEINKSSFVEGWTEKIISKAFAQVPEWEDQSE